jgi:hypothetical protein
MEGAGRRRGRLRDGSYVRRRPNYPARSLHGYFAGLCSFLKNTQSSDASWHAFSSHSLMYTHIKHVQGSKQDVRNQIGERLYHAIAAIHGDLAGKLTGMFLEATESYSDLALLIFSEPSLRFHCQQAMQVLNAPQQACSTPSAISPEKVQQKAQQPARSGMQHAPYSFFFLELCVVISESVP